MVEKDKRIAELLNTQIDIADASLLGDDSPSGIAPKFKILSFRGKQDGEEEEAGIALARVHHHDGANHQSILCARRKQV